jgi:LPXTG-site transpeptidase (sortase) family protein
LSQLLGGRRLLASASVLFALALAGCGTAAGLSGEPAAAGSADSPAGEAGTPSPAIPARVGQLAKSNRVRFIPERVTLPDGATAAVEPAVTVDGELKVPENVRHVGWWDGSAYVGDPYGSTVIAGHVDSATEGIGYFARLLRVKVGEKVTVGAGQHQLSYRITSVQTVTKQALASDSRAFDQTGDPRLVLITCTGAYHRDRGGYDSNLVVMAKPLGLAR